MPRAGDYETDFCAWTRAQAAAIRAKNWAAVDPERVARVVAPAYARARRRAAEDMGLPLAAFPEACPWLVAQVLDAEFLPAESEA